MKKLGLPVAFRRLLFGLRNSLFFLFLLLGFLSLTQISSAQVSIPWFPSFLHPDLQREEGSLRPDFVDLKPATTGNGPSRSSSYSRELERLDEEIKILRAIWRSV